MNLFSVLKNAVWIFGLLFVILGMNDLLPSVWTHGLSTSEIKDILSKDVHAFKNLQFDERTHSLFLTFNETSSVSLDHSSVHTFLPKSLPSFEAGNYLYPNNVTVPVIEYYDSVDWYSFAFRAIVIYLVIQFSWLFMSSYFTVSSSEPVNNLGLMGQGIKTSGYYEEISDVELRYHDVIGMEPIKEDLKLIGTMFKYNFVFRRQGVKIPKGLLFSGPPGVGKTLMAKAFAGEANCSFYSISGSDFKHPLVGVGGMIVKDVFDTAKKNSPAVIFIDEIDAIGQKRSVSLHGSGESSSTLNKILEQMDGFSTSDNIMVIAATNRPEILDGALTRTGRFDRKIAFDLPNKKERTELLKLYFSKVKLTPKFKIMLDHHINELTRQSAGMSGSDIASFINQGVLNYNKELFFMKEDDDTDTESTSDSESDSESDSDSDSDSNNEKTLFDAFKETDEGEPTEKMQNKKFEEIRNMIIKAHLNDISNETLSTLVIDGIKIIDKPLFDLLEEEDRQKNNDIKLKPFLKRSLYSEMTRNHFLKALNEIKVGIEKKERTMTDDEKKRVSYHEAGHALLSYMCKSTNPPIKITIVPHGEGALGFTMMEPDDRKMHLRSEILSQIAVLLGGTMAERIFFGEPGTGASDDLKRATKILTGYIARYGMDDSFGLLSLDLDNDNVPNELKNQVYYKANEMLNKIKDQVSDVIKNNKDHLESMAKYLLENEEILEENVRDILPKELESTISIS